MIRRWAIALGVAAALAAPRAGADDVAPSMPANPAAIEAAPPDVPIVVRQEDAAGILRDAPRSEPPPPASGGRTDVFAAEPQPVANQSSQFVFTDVTDRPQPRVKTLAERQAAVEAIRQSARPGGDGE